MYENELYPAVGKFLKTKKNCLLEYVGTELSIKRGKNSLRVERVAEDLGLIDKLIGKMKYVVKGEMKQTGALTN